MRKSSEQTVKEVAAAKKKAADAQVLVLSHFHVVWCVCVCVFAVKVERASSCPSWRLNWFVLQESLKGQLDPEVLAVAKKLQNQKRSVTTIVSPLYLICACGASAPSGFRQSYVVVTRSAL